MEPKRLSNQQVSRIIDAGEEVMRARRHTFADVDLIDYITERHEDAFTWDTLLSLAIDVRDLRASLGALVDAVGEITNNNTWDGDCTFVSWCKICGYGDAHAPDCAVMTARRALDTTS